MPAVDVSKKEQDGGDGEMMQMFQQFMEFYKSNKGKASGGAEQQAQAAAGMGGGMGMGMMNPMAAQMMNPMMMGMMNPMMQQQMQNMQSMQQQQMMQQGMSPQQQQQQMMQQGMNRQNQMNQMARMNQMMMGGGSGGCGMEGQMMAGCGKGGCKGGLAPGQGTKRKAPMMAMEDQQPHPGCFGGDGGGCFGDFGGGCGGGGKGGWSGDFGGGGKGFGGKGFGGKGGGGKDGGKHQGMEMGVFLGVIKSFVEKTGYGFIECAEMGGDVFLSAVEKRGYQVGQTVRFTAVQQRDGRPQAKDLRSGLKDDEWVCPRLIPAKRPRRAPREIGPHLGDFTGRIKSFSDKSGYGFIECPEVAALGYQDVFLHADDKCGYKIGEIVTFAAHLTLDGKPEAKNLLSEDDTDLGEFIGIIKSFVEKSGYGFIECPDVSAQGYADVFMHSEQKKDFNVGDVVRFHAIVRGDGKPQARNLQAGPENPEEWAQEAEE